MAILKQSILDGCSSIPDFINTGSRMVFYQASAPTSWTKVTTNELNHAAFRVVTGFGGGSGGSSGFTDVFTTRVVPLPLHSHSGTTGFNDTDHSHSGGTTSTGSHSHGHNFSVAANNSLTGSATYISETWARHGVASGVFSHAPDYLQQKTPEHPDTSPAGQLNINVNHSHGLSGGVNSTSSDHNHNVSVGNQSANHKHSFNTDYEGTSGASMNFAVKYVDVIICSKD